ncbi:XBP1 (YIL101C) [Zygosaccharomyces parabailii]|nr:XBP1 (YIL101C) [Zygosaccharomyces parabailii]CDH12895.1 uncharacterized protein ZBAI_04681 [Zygosaccharomyces bailii ISA1307]
MYRIHQFDLNGVQLSSSPLDDYQRLYFATLLSLPPEQQPNVDIRKVAYKSNVAEMFGPRANRSNVLECFEYQLPDVRGGWPRFSLDPETSSRLKLQEGGVLRGVVQAEANDAMEDSLTKNQQFKLRKLGHTLRSRLINPNNCVLWTHDSGYVFLTGIWRLYQDVMRGLATMERVDGSTVAAGVCREELEYITTQAFYDGHSPERKRRRHSSGGELGPAVTSTAYSDLHWNGLSSDLKRQLVDTYRVHLEKSGVPYSEAAKVSLSDVMQRIRGGYIKIQGTWLPLEMARIICTWFCFPIRFLLVPIFGPDFPAQCEAARGHALAAVPRGRSMSWDSGLGASNGGSNYSRAAIAGRNERLPPISTIIDSLDRYSQERREAQPTVQTLSHLASFYNTHGHKYSYPGVAAQQREWRRPSWEESRRGSVASRRNSTIARNGSWEYEFKYEPVRDARSVDKRAALELQRVEPRVTGLGQMKPHGVGKPSLSHESPVASSEHL